MRIISRLAVLAIIGGVASCGEVTSDSPLYPTPEAAPLKLLSAKRVSGGWNPRHREGEVEIPSKWLTRSVWMANPATLSRLESALLNRPWVSMTQYALNGNKLGHRLASQGRSWIDCSFSNGKSVRVFFTKSGYPRIFDGWHDGNGAFGYRLDISVVECQKILELSGWDKLEHRDSVSEVGSENDPVLGLMVKHPGAVFKSSLAHDSKIEPASVLVVKRSISSLEWAVDGGAEGHHVVMQAQDDTLRRLEKVVQGMRRSTLRFTMDGEVHVVERNEEPLERMVCKMSDGQTVEIHVFSSDGAWCVIGEGSFRLALTEDAASELLDLSGWSVSD